MYFIIIFSENIVKNEDSVYINVIFSNIKEWLHDRFKSIFYKKHDLHI